MIRIGLVGLFLFGILLHANAEDSLAFQQIGHLATPGFDATRIEIVGNVAVMQDRSTNIKLFDITNPTSPTLLNTLDLSGDSTLESSFVTSGTLLYIPTIRLAPRTGYLTIVDIANPLAPVVYPIKTTQDRAMGVALVNGMAVLSDDDAGFSIYDISNPNSIVLTGSYLEFNIDHVEAVGSNGFITNIDVSGGVPTTMSIYSLNSPSSITKHNSVSVLHEPDGMITSGTTVIGFNIDELYLLDASNPSNLTEITHYHMPGASAGGAFFLGYLLTAQSSNGVVAYNLGDLQNITEFGSFDTAGACSELAVKGDKVYVADGTNGLLVLSAQEVPVELSNFSID